MAIRLAFSWKHPLVNLFHKLAVLGGKKGIFSKKEMRVIRFHGNIMACTS